MKSPSLASALLSAGILAAGIAPAEEISDSAKILDPIADGSASPAAPNESLPNVTILNSMVQMAKIGTASSDGTKPAQRVRVTVQLIAPPNFDVVSTPMPSATAADSLTEGLEESGLGQDLKLAFVSATVYGDSLSFVRWYPDGDVTNEMSAWSNLNFNHFGGFASYQVKGIDGSLITYGLILGLGTGQIEDASPPPTITFAGGEWPCLRVDVGECFRC